MSIDNARSVHVLKFAGADLKIQWHFARRGIGSNTVPAVTVVRDDSPKFLVMDSND